MGAEPAKSAWRAGLAGAALAVISAAVIGCSGDTGPAPDGAAAPAKAAVRPAKPDLAQGREVYFKYCHFCHGQKGYGDGPVGIALSPHPADFVNDRKRMSKTDEEIYRSITEGIHRDIGGEAMSMPRWREILTDDERWGVLAFIRFLEKEGLRAAEENAPVQPGKGGR